MELHIHSIQTNYYYLTLTDDTNLTTTPIKFAPPPFVPILGGATSPVVWQNGFENIIPGNYVSPAHLNGGWFIDTGDVDIISGPEAYQGANYMDLNGWGPGEISTNITTVSGTVYSLNFAYTRNPGSITGVGGFPIHVPSAEVSIDGNPLAILNTAFTNSTADLDWHTTNFLFTATSAVTHLDFKSLDTPPAASGMYFDAISLTTNQVITSQSLYYLPEQSLDPLVGTSPYGTWQLEIQDDRVGATNHTVLDSWQLQFIFAQTNPVPADINGGSTNFIPAGGLAWYEVDVPTNADFATNILIFATGPLNMWYSTNVPPTIVNPGDVQFLSVQPSVPKRWVPMVRRSIRHLLTLFPAELIT